MTKTISILGRQPKIGIAELESLFGADLVHPAGETAAVVDLAPADFPMARLGGTVKAGKVLDTLPFTEWSQIEEYLKHILPDLTQNIPEGKIRLGLSTYGLKVALKNQNTTALKLKKVIRETGRSSRVVPNLSKDLNTAQVLHNQLTGQTGLELLFVANGNETILAQTFTVQDINAYTIRDRKRPKRDARVGMLPPKLAQIIINLASPKAGARVLDPFCGTGVVLQEAALMGYKVYGTDINERMIEYTRENMEWLAGMHGVYGLEWEAEVGDACTFEWKEFGAVAGETYLGRPFSVAPSTVTLHKVIRDVDTIHIKFLQNLAKQSEPGMRLCLALPAWKIRGDGFKHLPVLDSLEKLGYTRTDLTHVRPEELIYHRTDQIVARELVILERT